MAEKDLSTTVCTDSTILDTIKKGKYASRKICQYVDMILTTVNPQPPDVIPWTKPNIHPCRVRYADIKDHMLERDYTDLLNTVQRHTHCSTKYCLRHKQIESKLSCRFNFPFDKCETTKLDFQPVKMEKLITKLS